MPEREGASTTSPIRPVSAQGFHIWPILCFASVVVMPINGILVGAASLVWTLLVAGTVFVGAIFAARRPIAGDLSLIAGALVLVSTIAIWSTGDAFTHWRVGLQLSIYMAFMPWTLRGIFERSPAALWATIAGFLLGQSVSASAAVVQVMGVSVAGFGLVNGRAQGLAGNPNVLGLVSGVAAVVCAYLVLRSLGPRKLLVLTGLLNGAALIACGSISALIASVLGVLVLLAALRVPIRTPLLIAALGALVVWLLGRVGSGSEVHTPLDRVRQVTGQTDRVATWLERQDSYQAALERIIVSPFAGQGLDDASGQLPGLMLTHNVLLRGWYQGGIGIGVAFLLVYGVLAFIILRAILRATDAIPAAILTVVVAFSLTSAALHQEYFWMLLSAAWALATPTANSGVTPEHTGYAEYRDWDRYGHR